MKLSIKFTSREFSLKRMPSRKQTGVFGVKIAVVTKCVAGGRGSRLLSPRAEGALPGCLCRMEPVWACSLRGDCLQAPGTYSVRGCLLC